MKGLLIVLVLALAGAGGWYYYTHQGNIAPALESATPAAAGAAAATPAVKRGFGEVIARLQADMSKVPSDLRQQRQIPAAAFDTRSRLEPYVKLHEEYRTLTTACNVIIDIDQECGERQTKCGIAPLISANGLVARPEQINVPIYQQQEIIWTNHRQVAEAEVRRLLETLRNSQL